MIISNWRGKFEILPNKELIEIGDYYLVDYNTQSHPASPHKESEVVMVISDADCNGYYKTDRGTKFKDYCIVYRVSLIETT